MWLAMRECRTLRWNRGAPLTDEPAAHVRAKETNVWMVVATATMFVLRMVEALAYDEESMNRLGHE